MNLLMCIINKLLIILLFDPAYFQPLYLPLVASPLAYKGSVIEWGARGGKKSPSSFQELFVAPLKLKVG